MSLRYCNVALPVPLRTLFTYSVPEALRETVQVGSRVLVPFRKSSMVGVVVAMLAERPAELPEKAKIRDVTKSSRSSSRSDPQSDGARPMDCRLLSRAGWRSVSRHAASGHRSEIAARSRANCRGTRSGRVVEAGRECAAADGRLQPRRNEASATPRQEKRGTTLCASRESAGAGGVAKTARPRPARNSRTRIRPRAQTAARHCLEGRDRERFRAIRIAESGATCRWYAEERCRQRGAARSESGRCCKRNADPCRCRSS